MVGEKDTSVRFVKRFYLAFLFLDQHAVFYISTQLQKVQNTLQFQSYCTDQVHMANDSLLSITVEC